MVSAMQKIIDLVRELSRRIGTVSALLILPLIAVVVYSVIMRYIFNSPPQWSFEIALFLFGINITMGGIYCQLKQKHIEVDILKRLVGPKGQATIRIASLFSAVFVCMVILWYGAPWAISSTKILERSIHQTAFNPPIWWFKWFVPVSAGLMGLQALVDLVEELMQIFKNGVDNL
jgi:TRAP-type C4-dicarboxylate transport system permease small subunit